MGFKAAWKSGTRKGVDHFREGTFPYVDIEDVSNPVFYPVGFTFDELGQLLNKVREWRVEGSASYSITGGGGGESYTINEDNQDPYDSGFAEELFGSETDAKLQDRLHNRSIFGPCADERFLAYSYGPVARYIAIDPTHAGPNINIKLLASFVMGGLFLTNGYKNPSIAYDEDAGLFYPNIQFGLTFNFSTGGGGFGMGTTVASDKPVVGSLELLGKTIDLRTTVDPLVTTLSASLNTVPKKWWTYSNSEGEDVWNEDTGNPENPPFS